jgi:hypothetical protein
MDGKVKMKAGLQEFMKLKKEQTRFALYNDLKDLHGKVVPPIDTFQDQLQDFRKEHYQMQQII